MSEKLKLLKESDVSPDWIFAINKIIRYLNERESTEAELRLALGLACDKVRFLSIRTDLVGSKEMADDFIAQAKSQLEGK